MALNASALKGIMKSKVSSIDFTSGEKNNDEILQALAEAIVEHIKADAQVIVSGGSSSGTYSVL